MVLGWGGVGWGTITFDCLLPHFHTEFPHAVSWARKRFLYDCLIFPARVSHRQTPPQWLHGQQDDGTPIRWTIVTFYPPDWPKQRSCCGWMLLQSGLQFWVLTCVIEKKHDKMHTNTSLTDAAVTLIKQHVNAAASSSKNARGDASMLVVNPTMIAAGRV